MVETEVFTHLVGPRSVDAVPVLLTTPVRSRMTQIHDADDLRLDAHHLGALEGSQTRGVALRSGAPSGSSGARRRRAENFDVLGVRQTSDPLVSCVHALPEQR